jgi:hypothetical protein
MAYTDIDKPSDYFNTVLYTGNASASRSITGVGFQPDWLWVKGRSTAYYHALWDVVRTNKSALYSNVTNAEDTGTGGTLGSFNSDGFTLPNESGGFVNNNGTTYTAWNWKAGTSFTNDASATGIGSVDSTGSVNTDAGFSIVSWTSLASGSNYTIAHALGVKPDVIIMKGRHESNSWQVYHHKNTSSPETDYLELNSTAATADYPVWNDTAPTSSVFSLGTWSGFDAGGTMIAYCFAEKQGYSKFSSYVGNGGNQFIYTGFKPAFVIEKRSSNASEWDMYDNKRNTFNSVTKVLKPNASDAEATYGGLNFLSNGFEAKGSLNDSGQTLIYMAFAENPFVTSTGVPATAR